VGIVRMQTVNMCHNKKKDKHEHSDAIRTFQMDFFVLQQTTMLTINCLKMSKEWHKIVVTKQTFHGVAKCRHAFYQRKQKTMLTRQTRSFPYQIASLVTQCTR